MKPQLLRKRDYEDAGLAMAEIDINAFIGANNVNERSI